MNSNINRRIALIKGYRVVEPDRLRILSDSKWHYHLLDPDGNNIIPNDGYSISEDKAWSNLPDWEHDLKLAMGLFEGDEDFTLGWFRNRWEAYHNYQDGKDGAFHLEFSETLDGFPVAICNLWLSLNKPPSP